MAMSIWYVFTYFMKKIYNPFIGSIFGIILPLKQKVEIPNNLFGLTLKTQVELLILQPICSFLEKKIENFLENDNPFDI